MAEPNTNPVQEPETNPEKTFTQAEVDTLIGKRLAKALKGMPDEAELSAFRAWKENRKTEENRVTTLTQERDTANTALAAAQAELEQYKREKLLLDRGIPSKDVDYYAFKIGKLVTDKKPFEQAAEEYLKDCTTGKNVRVDMTGVLGGGKPNNEPRNLSEALYAKYNRQRG